MKVWIKLYATLTDYLPPGSRNNQAPVEAPEGASVTAVLDRFNLPPKLVHLVLVNGVYIAPADRATRVLQPEDHLAVWPPIAGG